MTKDTHTRVDDWEEHWLSYAAAARLNPAQHYRHALLVRELRRLGVNPGDHLLDVGSGQGDFLALLHHRLPGLNLVGFEMSRAGVEFSRQKLPQATFFEADLFSPPADLSAYTAWARCATCSEVLEHLDDPTLFLSRITHYVEPGGHLLITVPAGPMSAFDRHIGHRQHFTNAKLRKMGLECGLECVRVWRAGFPFFNLYRLMVILSGRRLISRPDTGLGSTARALSRLFDLLFRANLPTCPLGWQQMAHFKRPASAG